METLCRSLNRSDTFRRGPNFAYQVLREKKNSEKLESLHNEPYFDKESEVSFAGNGIHTVRNQKTEENFARSSRRCMTDNCRKSFIEIRSEEKSRRLARNNKNPPFSLSSDCVDQHVEKEKSASQEESTEKSRNSKDLRFFEEGKVNEEYSASSNRKDWRASEEMSKLSQRKKSLSFTVDVFRMESKDEFDTNIELLKESECESESENKSYHILPDSSEGKKSIDFGKIPSLTKIESDLKSLRLSIIEKNDVKMISFEEALCTFNQLSFMFSEKILWHRSWCTRFLACCRETELDGEFLEICEKFIVFSYIGFFAEDYFHKTLLENVFSILSYRCDNKECWAEIGFSDNNPYENDLQHHTAAAGLFALLFLDRYFPTTLNEMLKVACKDEIAFVLVVFDMTEIVASALRREKLNVLIADIGKCLETLLFLVAGCLIFWMMLHMEHDKTPAVINLIVEKTISKEPLLLINLARDELNKQ